MTIDLRREAVEFRNWIERKVASTVGGEPIGAIVALYCYVQDGWIALDFNTDPEFEFDGDVSEAAWGDLFQRPEWQTFAETEGSTPMTFINIDGSSDSVPAEEMDDDFLAGHFGQMIADVLASAWRDGVFAHLKLRPGLVVSVNDFNGNWGS